MEFPVSAELFGSEYESWFSAKSAPSTKVTLPIFNLFSERNNRHRDKLEAFGQLLGTQDASSFVLITAGAKLIELRSHDAIG